MNYIYHIKPRPFIGTFLIPLNMMDKESDLYKDHAKKYVGREGLMNEVIPLLNCKWNDVVQFSGVDPKLIVDKLKTIQDDFKIPKIEYFKIHVSQIVETYEAVVFCRNPNSPKGNFKIHDSEVQSLTHSYRELTEVPKATIDYWEKVKREGGQFLWFPFVPHIFVKGIIDTREFEVCELSN